jgi:hypothetical protein
MACVPRSESFSNFVKDCFPAAGLQFLIMYKFIFCTLDSSGYMNENMMDEQMDEYILDENIRMQNDLKNMDER